jgi:hypothetical protein
MIFLANMVWPALYLMERYYSWWAIALGLIIEYTVLRYISNENQKKIIYSVFISNALTALVGYFAIPYLTLAWEFVLSFTVYQLLDVGTFNPFGWFSSIIIMAAITAFPELLIIRKIFKIELKKNAWIYLWGANIASVALAFITVLIWPVKL